MYNWPTASGNTVGNVGGVYSTTPKQFWEQVLATGMSYDDFYMNIGYAYDEPNPTGITDPKMKSDLQEASKEAKAIGDTNFAKILDFILNTGDKALGILTKTGVLQNKNLLAAQGYSNYGTNADGSTWYGQARTPTNEAPRGKSGFNIDFTDPKTLIIGFLILVLIFSFFLFKPSTKQNGKR